MPPDLQTLEPYVISLSPSPSLSPSTFEDPYVDASLFFPSVLVARSGFDLATVAIIAALLLLSVVSFSFIFYLRIKSRRMQHLQNFNSLWTVRLLLVTFAFLWAVNEIIRLPNVRRKYFDPFLTLNQQTNLCKFHVVLSFGFYEPGFLITLLFLVNVSIKKKKPMSNVGSFMRVHGVFTHDIDTDNPCLFFAIGDTASQIRSWVLDFVINKSIRVRINMLAAAVMVALPLQILCLGLSWLWIPEDDAYGWVVLVMFFCITSCMAVGEVILIIKPIIDALVAGGDCCRRFPGGFLLSRSVEQRERLDHQEPGQ
ncbi:Uncharacterized protein Adt_12577 [Abeliophyllum distichum]|uniref:Uncharacterized protein n=1 Tax=Abeliophyllum distichum TaxID=126358 RepID=A0ABD1USV7_9LAMI